MRRVKESVLQSMISNELKSRRSNSRAYLISAVIDLYGITTAAVRRA